MIFFIKRNVINVDLFTSHDAVFQHARPKKAASFMPDWWKNTPNTQYEDNKLRPTHTIKTCTGFLDLYASGFIHPLWSDLNIEINPDGTYRYLYADGVSGIHDHKPHQFPGSPFSENYVQLKLLSPWIAKTKDPAKWLFVPPVWNGVGIENMHIAHGVMPLNVIPSPLHINMFFKKQETSVIHKLPFGLPIAHIIPLSDKAIKFHYHLIDEVQLNKLKYQSSESLFFTNRFRKAKKLCPHA